MRSEDATLDASVRAFRALTAAEGLPDATRQRILARADERARRGRQLRRTLAAAAVLLVILTTGAAARTAIGWWRGHTTVTASPAVPEAPVTPISHRPHRSIPAARAEAAVAEGVPNDGAGRAEADAYGRAHRAHFVDDRPDRALRAWDAYLVSYPHGVFAPEARFNRALALVRLERWRDAARALEPFARGRDGGYRQTEACALLAWLRPRTSEPAVAGGCVSGVDGQ
jgi:TolA-binding protein